MVKLLVAAALVASGCNASLGGDTTNSIIDGNNGGGGRDSGGGGNTDAPTDSTSNAACANGRKVFLEFGGVTLTDDATVSDAPTNKARWLTNASAAIPPWRNGSGTRLTEIQQVVDEVKQRLAATPIEVVTTRPTSGPYVMVVLGGANGANGGTVGTQYAYATSYHDCGDTLDNDVAWVSDMNPNATALGADAPTTYVADLVVGAIGWGLGLDGTTDTNGCMCGWTTACTSAAGDCTLSASITSGIGNGETACTNGTQNEVAAFSTNFCQ